MITVRKILRDKGSLVWSVSPKATVHEALKLMAEKNVGALLVLNQDGQPVGIFSERDYARAGAMENEVSRQTRVDVLMSDPLHEVEPDATMEDCMVLFTEKRIRHLPVTEDGVLIGIISIGDVVNEMIAEQQMTIRELAKYIYGRS